MQTDERILIDFRTRDDAGVYRWDAGPALVQTVDFFTPIVDDPYQYGQIAAANALSDVYAMGGRPVTALAIAGFPDGGLDEATIRAIFRGGFDKLREAGAVLLGGHTVRDREIKFGYAITGAVEPDRLLSNAGARPGDRLFLTKPIGTGIVGTAIKFERAPDDLVQQAVASMCQLNRAAAEAIEPSAASDVHACTDVTGFGLAGHAIEMAEASGVTLEIEAERIPVFDGLMALVAQNRSGGLVSNQEHFAARIRFDGAVDPRRVDLLYDPQTSGGLLVAVAAGATTEMVERFRQAGVSAVEIGRIAEFKDAGARLVVRGQN